MSHGLRHRYTRTLAGRWIIHVRSPEPCAALLRPPRRRYAAAPRSAAPTRVRKPCRRCLPVWSQVTRIVPYCFSAAVFASSKTQALRFLARGRTAGPFARWPPARRSVCSNTSVWLPTPFNYAAPLVTCGRAVNETLTNKNQIVTALGRELL